MRYARTALGSAVLLGICAVVSDDAGAMRAHSAIVSARAASDGIVDLSGRVLKPFAPTTAATVVFFIATDCPISNSYAPEIQRICRDYRTHGIDCALMYEDVDLSSSSSTLDDVARRHLREYRYADVPAAVDRKRTIAKRAQATVTPQAVVIDRTGKIRYRGRIDNFYAALGRTRRAVTEHDLRDALDAVLSGKPVPKAETEALGCYIVDPALMRK